MKKLIIGLALLFSLSSYGQQFEFRTMAQPDTIPVLLLIGDTAYVPNTTASYDADGNLLAQKDYKTKQGLCWWERGYVVRNRIENMTSLEYRPRTRPKSEYLNADKKQFPKSQVVFLSKDIE